MKRNTPALIFMLFGIIGLLLLVGAFFAWYSVQQFNATAVKTTGTVISLEPRVGSSSNGQQASTTYAPVFRFADAAGNTHEFTSTVSSNPPSYKVGDPAVLYYNPNDPDDVKEAGLLEFMGATVVGGMGVIFSLIGGIGFFLSAPQSRKLKKTGQLVRADIIGVDINRLITVNHRRHPFQIRCQWRDPLTGVLHTFKSGNIMDDPTMALQGRKQIDVYMDPQRPAKYYVDLDFLG